MDERDPIDAIGPWTIKAVATKTRELVTNAARRESLTVGQWLEKRVAEWESDGSPTSVASSATSGKMTTADLIEIARTAAQAKAAGQGGMTEAGQVAGRLLHERLRASEGLPPPAVRVRPPRPPAPVARLTGTAPALAIEG